RHMVEVLNKVDLMEPDVCKALLARNRVASRMLTGEQIAVSALSGAGLDALVEAVDRRLGAAEQTIRLTLAPEDGAGLAWAYKHGRVLERRDTEKAIYLVMSGADAVVDRFAARFPGRLTIVDEHQRRAATSS